MVVSDGAGGNGRRRPLVLAAAASVTVAATVGLAFTAARMRRKRAAGRRVRRCLEQLHRWCSRGPAAEPVVDIEVPISMSSDAVETDGVEVPIGLIFECDRLLETLRNQLLGEKRCKTEDSNGNDEVDVELVEALCRFWPNEEEEEELEKLKPENETPELPVLQIGWLDLAALAQLTYWYDRRPFGENIATVADDTKAMVAASRAEKEERLSEAKYGRWTKKLSKEKVVYGTVALRYRTRGHLGQKVFRRPAGIDVTRLATLRRAATLCGHDVLTAVVEETMEQLQPKNVAHIPWAEVEKHQNKDDLWLLIDGKVYDVTPFLDLHPGGGQLIVEASGFDATSLFEMTHGSGLRYSLRLLNQFFIGVCDGASESKPARPDVEATPEFLGTLRTITGALHTFDEARATGEAQGLLAGSGRE
eukprot:TRINITY_DN17240_c0_g1_i1.p1 TRINITY_DN17240_c0_g1~~TRINITY_DN17240_c0_g1_i1.p1  ORF type:complete len:419 (-),score=87.77 TRINITY_DN17240_c0_g1_i1:85-1341(-)